MLGALAEIAETYGGSRPVERLRLSHTVSRLTVLMRYGLSKTEFDEATHDDTKRARILATMRKLDAARNLI